MMTRDTVIYMNDIIMFSLVRFKKKKENNWNISAKQQTSKNILNLIFPCPVGEV